MYAGRVACCPLVSHTKWAPRALVMFKKTGQTERQTDRQTDGRQTVTLRLPLDACPVVKGHIIQ